MLSRLPDAALQWVVCVHTLLSALAMSTGPGARPPVLKITAGGNGRVEYMTDDALGVDDDAFRIPPFLRPSVGPVVEALEELELDVHNRRICRKLSFTNPADDDMPAPLRTRNLRAFLGMPKRLRKLRICRLASRLALDRRNLQADFWGWLAAKPAAEHGNGSQHMQEEEGPATSMIIPSPTLSHLRELDLRNVDIPSTQLFELIQKVSPTLEKLTL